MYTVKHYTYHIPINPVDDSSKESQTIAMVQIWGSQTERFSLMTKWLRHTFRMTRKEAHKAIMEMGFDDLFHPRCTT